MVSIHLSEINPYIHRLTLILHARQTEKLLFIIHGGVIQINVDGSYYSDPDSAGLWIINTDGTNPHLILKGGEECANWSPDGQWIVFESEAQIYKAPVIKDSLDMSHLVQLTFASRNFFPAWSPDGQWITYNMSICEGPNSCGIWLMSTQGTQQRFLAAYGNYPNWDPLDMRILYLTRAVTTMGQVVGDSIWKFDVQANSKYFFLFLGGNNYDSRHPKYAPDGMKIALESNANIWIINSDGTNLKQTTVNGGLQPSWSPDGKKIVYIGFTFNKYDPQNNGTLWVMDADGSNKRQLTYGPKSN